MPYSVFKVLEFAIDGLETALNDRLIWDFIPAMEQFTKKWEELKTWLHTEEKEKLERRIERIFLNLPQLRVKKTDL